VSNRLGAHGHLQVSMFVFFFRARSAWVHPSAPTAAPVFGLCFFVYVQPKFPFSFSFPDPGPPPALVLGLTLNLEL